MSENYYPRHGEQSPSDEDIRIARLEDTVAQSRIDRVRLMAELEFVRKERDEARAEVERLRKAKHTSGCIRQSAYNVECVCGADEAQRDLLRTVAERQREACAATVDRLVALVQAGAGEATLGQRIVQAARVVRATPLVTEGDK